MGIKVKATDISNKVAFVKWDSGFKAVRSPLKMFAQTTSSDGWVFPEYDLANPYRILDVESIFRQSVEKKTSLAFKHGYEFTSKNKVFLNYIKTRFAQISYATGIPTVLLMRKIFRDLAICNNAFIVKVRDKNKSGGKSRKQGGKTLQPVAGYFHAHPSTMQPYIKNGRIVKWRHVLPSGQYKEFNIEDVIHFHSGLRAGFFFAPPLVTPVEDDIRALRKIEENVELMLYQYLFPLFHYTVGTDEYPAGVTEDGQDEIEVAQKQLLSMTAEGGIVTSHRHKIELLGIQGRQMNAENYLKHFLRRVLGGLGLSEIDIGISDSANRSTAESFSRSLVDAVKDLQLVIKNTVENEIILELLLESGLVKTPMDLFDEKNKVRMDWHEIDIDYLVKIQNHDMDIFLKNGITYTELRQSLGRDPIRKKSKEAADLQWEWFEKPSLLIRAVDEPYLEMLSARSEGMDIEEGDIPEARKYREKMIKLGKSANKPAGSKSASPSKSKTNIGAKVKPTNQHGSAVPVPPKKDELESLSVRDAVVRANKLNKTNKKLLKDQYKLMKTEIIDFVKQLGRKPNERDMAYIRQIMKQRQDKMIFKIKSYSYRAYREGAGTKKIPIRALEQIDTRAEKYVSKLVDDLYSSISKAIVDTEKADGKITQEQAISVRFDAMEFRVEALGHVETKKAFALGQIHDFVTRNELVDTNNPVVAKTKKKELKFKLKDMGTKVPVLSIEPGEGACDRCEFVSESVVLADPYDIYYGDVMERIIPVHPNCECKMSMDIFDISTIEDEAKDGKKLESCVSQVKAKLAGKHKNWSDKKISSAAWAICKSKGLK